MGQHMDMHCCKKPSLFTYESLLSITGLKTTEYTLVLPLQLSIFLASTLNIVLTLADKSAAFGSARLIGCLFQMQDDFLDIYGHNFGKLPIDVEEGKCTWPVVMAMSAAKPDERQEILRHYGTPDGRATVTACFDSLHLKPYYEKQEAAQYQAIEEKLSAMEHVALRTSFSELLVYLFKRTF